MKRAGIAFLVLTASILISGILFENDARNEGFESVNDRHDANSVGIYDPAVWKAEKAADLEKAQRAKNEAE